MRREFTSPNAGDRINEVFNDLPQRAVGIQAPQESQTAPEAPGTFRLNLLARRQARWNRRALRA